jgi:histidinol-phosphate aminotransferase
MISEADLKVLLDLPVLVVLDEAYIEFSEEESRMPWVQQYPNLVVLRTFSKSAGGWVSCPWAMLIKKIPA